MAAGMEELFRAHWPLVFGYLARRTGDTTVAEELAQETFYRATRAFLGWRGESPAAWLLAIARNALADEGRRGRASSRSRTSCRNRKRHASGSTRCSRGSRRRSVGCWSSCTWRATRTPRSLP